MTFRFVRRFAAVGCNCGYNHKQVVPLESSGCNAYACEASGGTQGSVLHL